MEFDEEQARRDDAFYDELERAYIAELEHVRAGGVDLTEAILREEVYERLIGELEREDVSSDARDAVASFLQDLRRDGVEWHSIGHGRGYFEADDERRVFPEYAAPCTRATRIPGSVCMKFAHEHGAPWDQWTCEYAAGFGNLQSLQYAHEHGCPWDVSTCQAAAEYGHLDCLRYAHENGCPWNEVTCAHAASNGHLDCLRYAREHGCPWNEKTCLFAVSNGHLDCLRYARENGCPWNWTTCAYAALNGHLDCLRYAREHGCPWNEWTCLHAVSNGHLDCLRYARENGCCWDKRTCDNAAKNGYLDCLRYAREHGCPWNEKTCASAAKYGQLECLKYACARKCPGSDRYAEALNEVVIPDVDESFGVDVALAFQRANDGEISMREFLPLWVAHREGYRDAHLEVVRNLIAHD